MEDPPAIDRAHRASLSIPEMEREFGVTIRKDVAELYLNPILHIRTQQKSDGWHQMRAKHITASRVAGILRSCPYTKPVDVLTGYVFPERNEFRGGPAVDFGNKYEDAGIQAFEDVMRSESHAVYTLPFDLLLSPKHPDVFAVSPDGITNDGELVENKCPHSRLIIPGYVPPQYENGQIQYSLAVLGLEHCEYIEYLPPRGGSFPDDQVSITRVTRRPEWGEKNIPQLLEFWSDVGTARANAQLPDKYCRRGVKRSSPYLFPYTKYDKQYTHPKQLMLHKAYYGEAPPLDWEHPPVSWFNLESRERAWLSRV